ncbi:hypothetical protein EIP91_010425 [Steccherinum ochraceum]|uniref:Uncharacterized protein n=1 Tax=Steccherinum ochraceum TaxID=92696 RepID=A0A4R0R0M1_9APHY|nr:hypothetical protein EIP91_010425 [Steccherinum ochraceum]
MPDVLTTHSTYSDDLRVPERSELSLKTVSALSKHDLTSGSDLDAEQAVLHDGNVGAASSAISPELDAEPVHTANPLPATRTEHPTLNFPGPPSTPSSFDSTPFDVSESRFEYPFPIIAPDPNHYEGPASPAFSGLVSSFSEPPSSPCYSPHGLPRDTAVASSHMYHRLRIRDPPVPPSLANKRRWSSAGTPASPPPQFKSIGRGRNPNVKTQAGHGTVIPRRSSSEEGKVKDDQRRVMFVKSNGDVTPDRT